jgi:hypothetical protein
MMSQWQDEQREQRLYRIRSILDRRTGQVGVVICNHPVAKWSPEQIAALGEFDRELGERVVEIPFPEVPIEVNSDDLWLLAEKLVEAVITARQAYDVAGESKVTGANRCRVMVQGEPTLTVALVTLLQEQGYTPVAAVSRREAIEESLPDGGTRKVSIFRFCGWRKYPRIARTLPPSLWWHPPIVKEGDYSEEIAAVASRDTELSLKYGEGETKREQTCPKCGQVYITGMGPGVICPVCTVMGRHTKFAPRDIAEGRIERE